ncbi:polysaccharide deacetylase family protein [Rufibacter roseus]|uniref:Polysaccharide deacetylase family protein n=1 Tax=Rufibacter roseus TaxID=1567108 RepID=A0ABW2DPS9_9BACT|nr:polysaccharide deacetylase family protein [Rufibacter roseus]
MKINPTFVKPHLLRALVILIFCFIASPGIAQDWNKKKAAVVLTYDDALNVHLDHVLPALDSLGLKGTFYLTAGAQAFRQRLPEWEKVANNKHELANHTLFHPCDGSLPGRSFVSEYDLAKYSIRRLSDEIKMTNTVLQALDGKTERTFAYPCGDTKAGGESFVPMVKENFVAARGVQKEMLPRQATDVYMIGCHSGNGQNGEELIALVKEAIQNRRMIVFLFHGVGGEHSLNVSRKAHAELLGFLKKHEKEIWNPTFIEAAKYLKSE